MFGRLAKEIHQLMDEGLEYDRHTISDNTALAYQQAWASFASWCAENEVSSLPALAEVIQVYVTYLARRLKPSSIKVHLAAIRHYHLSEGHPSPTSTPIVRSRLSGINRCKRTAPIKKRPLLLDELETVLLDAPKSLRDHRNRALLAVAWAAGLRRSELVGLDCDDSAAAPGFVRFTSQGMEVVLNRSKTDQEGAGRTIAVPLRRDARKCPVRLLQKWMQLAKLRSGPLFRPINKISGKLAVARLRAATVARIVKKAAKDLGFDQRFYAGHSLRAGFVSSVAAAGASVPAIQATTGHKQITTLFGYVRMARLYDDSALRAIPSW